MFFIHRRWAQKNNHGISTDPDVLKYEADLRAWERADRIINRPDPVNPGAVAAGERRDKELLASDNHTMAGDLARAEVEARNRLINEPAGDGQLYCERAKAAKAKRTSGAGLGAAGGSSSRGRPGSRDRNPGSRTGSREPLLEQKKGN